VFKECSLLLKRIKEIKKQKQEELKKEKHVVTKELQNDDLDKAEDKTKSQSKPKENSEEEEK